jgi:RNA polymerase sigma-70 factor, ECF subfamily
MHSVQSMEGNSGAQGAQVDHLELLLGRCAERDEQALKELYQLVSPQLFGLLLRILKHSSLAEDALQDVMVRVWQHAGQYAAYRGRAMAWLVSVARYRAIDMLRTQHDHASIDELPLEMLPDLSAEDPSETTTPGRLRQALTNCLEGLSLDQRQSIALAYIDGCSHDEIAAAIGRPVGTVKSWLRRGLANLKRCLDS